MENPNKLQLVISFLTRHILFSIMCVAVIVLALVVSFLSLFIRPKPSTPPEATQNFITPVPNNTSFTGVTFKTTFSGALPTEADVYAKGSTPLPEADMKTIAQTFGFATEPQLLGGDYYWSLATPTPLLQISPSSSFISFTGAPVPQTGTPAITSASQVASLALQLIQGKGINTTNINITTPLIQYMTRFSEEPVYTQDFAQATVFLVSFPQTIQGVTIYRQYGQPSNVTVIFDKYLNIIQLSYYDIPKTFTAVRKVPLISVDELKNIITTGNGQIRQPYNLQLENGAVQLGLVFTLTSANLGYLIDTSYQELQPIFVTKGVVGGRGRTPQEAILYIPAVKQ